MKLAHGEAVLRTRVDDRKVELLVRCLQRDKQIKDHVDHFVRTRIFAVDLIDDHNRLNLVFQSLPQNETGLRLRTIVRVNHQQHAIDHFHDALDFAAEISMARRIDDIDAITVPLKSGVLCANGDPFLALEIH